MVLYVNSEWDLAILIFTRMEIVSRPDQTDSINIWFLQVKCSVYSRVQKKCSLCYQIIKDIEANINVRFVSVCLYSQKSTTYSAKRYC